MLVTAVFQAAYQIQGDTEAPVMVAPITVSERTESGFTLAWPAATDAVGVVSYEVDTGSGVYSNVGTARTLVVTGKTASATYNVRVRALDAAGNTAAPLTTTATTTASSTTPEVTIGAIDAAKVPAERRVVFEGSKRVVSFPGSIHKVEF